MTISNCEHENAHFSERKRASIERFEVRHNTIQLTLKILKTYPFFHQELAHNRVVYLQDAQEQGIHSNFSLIRNRIWSCRRSHRINLMKLGLLERLLLNGPNSIEIQVETRLYFSKKKGSTHLIQAINFLVSGRSKTKVSKVFYTYFILFQTALDAAVRTTTTTNIHGDRKL